MIRKLSFYVFNILSNKRQFLQIYFIRFKKKYEALTKQERFIQKSTKTKKCNYTQIHKFHFKQGQLTINIHRSAATIMLEQFVEETEGIQSREGSVSTKY